MQTIRQPFRGFFPFSPESIQFMNPADMTQKSSKTYNLMNQSKRQED